MSTPRTLWLPALLLFALGFAAPATAAPIPISGYDIGDAALSGHGGGSWSHTYTGTITPNVAFTHQGFPGTRALYSGVGGGTLTDGVVSAGEAETQLFVTGPTATDGTTFAPFITFTLPFAHSVDTIEIFGSDNSVNGIPGAITQVTVTLLKTDFTTVSETFATTPFGAVNSSLGVPVNDRIDLTGSSLDGVGAFAVTLSQIVTPGTEGGWFSITEVDLDGSLFTAPEPAALGMLGLAAAALAAARGRRR